MPQIKFCKFLFIYLLKIVMIIKLFFVKKLKQSSMSKIFKNLYDDMVISTHDFNILENKQNRHFKYDFISNI